MRKFLLTGTTAAAALLTFLAMAPAASASLVAHHVLTVGRVGGTNVKVNAVLKASLKSGTSATFVSSAGTVSCKKSTVTDKVTKNPAKPGTAKLTLTAQTVSKCTFSVSGVTVQKVTINKLPYKTTLSDSTGNRVTVLRPSTTISLKLGTATVTCTYAAKKIKGTASNTGQLISFSGQKFKLSSGSSLCSRTGTFSASYGPVADTSVAGHPHVFVN